MDTFIAVILSLAVGYFLGSINTSIIVGKLNGIDIRECGSRNAGTTNTLRILGKKAAFFVLLGDLFKGILACVAGVLIARLLGTDTVIILISKLTGGLGGILGHNWPLYFRFKGGKGILTSFAVIMMADYRASLILIGIFAIILLATKYVSAGSITAAVMLPVVFLLLHSSIYEIIFTIIIAILAIARHRGNIVRLLNGSESRINFRRTVNK